MSAGVTGRPVREGVLVGAAAVGAPAAEGRGVAVTTTVGVATGVGVDGSAVASGVVIGFTSSEPAPHAASISATTAKRVARNIPRRSASQPTRRNERSTNAQIEAAARKLPRDVTNA